jgi:hypothetical protein
VWLQKAIEACMAVLLIPLVLVAFVFVIGVALFVFLPVKWAIVAAIVCFVVIGGIMSLTSKWEFH